MGLECRANPVSKSTRAEIIRITRGEALTRSFRGKGPVRDREFLGEGKARERLEKLCRINRTCASHPLSLADFAGIVTDRLNVSPSWYGRTLQNVQRLFMSRRVTNAEVVQLVTLAAGPDKGEELAAAAQAVFSKTGLFYYKLFPRGSTVVCYGTP